MNYTIFGESHGPAIGVVLEDVPSGISMDMDFIAAELRRRATGNSPLSTPRKEADIPEFLSGLREGRTCGTPLTAILKSANTRSGDYDALRDVPRPGHADYTAYAKYEGFQDARGGGHFSGRITAALVAGGALVLGALNRAGIEIVTHIGRCAGISDAPFALDDPAALAAQAGESANPNGRVIDLILPVLVLIVTCTLGMIYVGGFFGVDMSGDPSFAGDFIGAFGNTDAFVGLPWGGVIALVLTVIYLVARKVLSFKEAMACVPKGFVAMVPPIIILTLAVSLKAMINSLGADVYVYDLMFAASEWLYSMLPAVIFVVACILAFASGTSWGTFGILIPIVTAVFPADSTLLIIGISACCAGAVCGDHCSPISDTTIMASAGAQCEHLDHVTTQLPYAITVAAVSFVGFIVAGFVQNVYITWLVSAALLLGVLLFLRAREQKKEA